jgi:hypothetical protein
MHIIRNSIDHGIELPDSRKQKGKPERGVVQNKEKKIVAYSKVQKIGSIKTPGQSVGILMVSLALHKVITKI